MAEEKRIIEGIPYIVKEDGTMIPEVKDKPVIIEGYVPEKAKLDDSGKKISAASFIIFMSIPVIALVLDLVISLLIPSYLTNGKYFIMNGVLSIVKEIRFVVIAFIVVVGVGRMLKKEWKPEDLIAEMPKIIGMVNTNPNIPFNLQQVPNTTTTTVTTQQVPTANKAPLG